LDRREVPPGGRVNRQGGFGLVGEGRGAWTTTPTTQLWRSPSRCAFQGRKRVHNADELMARIVAQRLVDYLSRAGFVVMAKPPAPGHAVLGRGEGRRRMKRMRIDRLNLGPALLGSVSV